MSKKEVVPKNDYYAGSFYHTCFDPFTTMMRDKIAEIIPQKTTVLDVGCGTGYQLLRASHKLESGVGVDIADKMIDFAKKQQKDKEIENVSFDLASAADLSRFKDNEFDLATMTLVLHEMDDLLRVPALKEIVRVSKRQVITDYAISAGPIRKGLAHLIEMTVGIFHYHLFRSYLKQGGVPGLLQKIGLSCNCKAVALMGMVNIWVCEKELD